MIEYHICRRDMNYLLYHNSRDRKCKILQMKSSGKSCILPPYVDTTTRDHFESKTKLFASFNFGTP